MILGINNIFQANIAQNKRVQTNPNSKAKVSDLQSDTVSFGKKTPTPNARMRNYAQMFLKEIGLKKDQPLHITAEAKYVPFMRVLEEEAYKRGSGHVSRKTIEPEFEALKKKHGITEDFDYKALVRKELEDQGALFVTFDEKNCPYKKSGLTKSETRKLAASITDKYPKEVEDEYQLDPKEILKDALDMHPGEPLHLVGQREHLPRMLALADWAYGQNGTKLVNVVPTEKKEFHPEIPFFEHGADHLIEEISPTNTARLEEFAKRDVARLILRGDDPTLLKELSPEAKKRATKHNAAYGKAVKEQQEEIISNHPWLGLWMPSTRAIQESYAEHADQNTRMVHALRDGKKINRTGQLAQHIERLQYMTQRLNALLDRGFRSMQVISFDPKTWKPDGKSNLIVGLSDMSQFMSARMNMKRSGHNVLVNLPTEESFTAPKAFPSEKELLTGVFTNVTRGHVSATKPFVVNGVVIDDMRLEVENGKIVEATARTNQDFLRDFIEQNENGDRFAEFAVVEESYLAQTGKVFKNTLLDENTTVHIAIGDAYSETVKGAEEIVDFQEREKYLKKHGINRSTTHKDFMVGGPNVKVIGINEETGEQVLVLDKNKFQL